MSKLVYLAPLLVLLIGTGVVFGDVVSSLTIVVYKDGAPLGDATVELWYNGTLAYRGVTDTNGTLTLSNVSTGTYTIYVYHNGTVWKFTKVIDVNTTSIVLNITDDSIEYLIGLNSAPFWGRVSSSPVLLYTGIGVLLIVLLLLAYAFSGKKVPRRR